MPPFDAAEAVAGAAFRLRGWFHPLASYADGRISMAGRKGIPWRHPERSRFSGGGRDLSASGTLRREIPRPAGKDAGLRDDADKS